MEQRMNVEEIKMLRWMVLYEDRIRNDYVCGTAGVQTYLL